MARTKRIAVERTPSDLLLQSNGKLEENVTDVKPQSQPKSSSQSKSSFNSVSNYSSNPLTKPGIINLLFCVGGIYASFLTWAVLQERITTTTYGNEKFKYPVFLNTIQSIFAALSGLTYLFISSSSSSKTNKPIFPTIKILSPLLLVSITSSLASPFGYSSLQYIDYITFILAKSCKLLPLMVLNLTIFKKSYPIYKYLIVLSVTLGVSIFTLHHPSTNSKASKHNLKTSSNTNDKQLWGLLLLGINLLFDGLFNTTQDYIFQTFKPYSGPQMMSSQNILSTIITSSWLILAPLLQPTVIGKLLSLQAGNELKDALNFVSRNPSIGYDIFIFSLCGAIGQVFIFHTLSNFSSLLLVTVNVTRKMITMILSVIWFGHKITPMQWLGVSFVFGAIGSEAIIHTRLKSQLKINGDVKNDQKDKKI